METVTDIQSPVTKGELENYRRLVKKYENHEKVEARHKKNVLREGVAISEKAFWRCFVIGILTTQTKSGKHSPLQNFLDSNPDILNYNYCIALEGKADIENKIPVGVTRFRKRACLYIIEAIEKFQHGVWFDLEKQLKTIKDDTTLENERIVADFIVEHFNGIGQKQSRNIIQMMGLSKYVLPIDSRVMKKIEELSGIKVEKLSNKNYILIEDRVQSICKKIGVYPCIFDACAFYSQE